jgi:hypothetical protein
LGGIIQADNSKKEDPGMFSRNTAFVWLGVVMLSGMFLLGQEAWPPDQLPPVDANSINIDCQESAVQDLYRCDITWDYDLQGNEVAEFIWRIEQAGETICNGFVAADSGLEERVALVCSGEDYDFSIAAKPYGSQPISDRTYKAFNIPQCVGQPPVLPPAEIVSISDVDGDLTRARVRFTHPWGGEGLLSGFSIVVQEVGGEPWGNDFLPAPPYWDPQNNWYEGIVPHGPAFSFVPGQDYLLWVQVWTCEDSAYSDTEPYTP